MADLLEMFLDGLFCLHDRAEDRAGQSSLARALMYMLRVLLWLIFAWVWIAGCALGGAVLKVVCAVLLAAQAALTVAFCARRKR